MSEKKQMATFLKGISKKVKHKQNCPGFELYSPVSLPKTITVTPRASETFNECMGGEKGILKINTSVIKQNKRLYE